MATPDLCRVERCTESNATSNTSLGSTWRTGPKRSTVWLRTKRSSSLQLLVGEAEIGLADRHQLGLAAFAVPPGAERVVRIIGRALAAAALRIHQHGVDA